MKAPNKFKNKIIKLSIDKGFAFDKYDTITMYHSQSAIIVRKVNNGENQIIYAYPFKFGKYKFLNKLKFKWIQLRVILCNL